MTWLEEPIRTIRASVHIPPNRYRWWTDISRSVVEIPLVERAGGLDGDDERTARRLLGEQGGESVMLANERSPIDRTDRILDA